ncbi:MAG: hypothetical protein IT352_09500 [Gemmatimonadales bacterium]|nr:hypothetical protein [Gemmatimonadales bacterium]
MHRTTLLLAVAIGLWWPTPAAAQRQERQLDIRGFGGWSVSKTNRNEFLGSDEDGEYRRSSFALNLSTPIAPRIQVAAQLLWQSVGDEDVANLDYAFVDWEVARNLHLRLGKAKHPFGLYSEVAGLGTVRPFLTLPGSVYGPVPIVSKSYRGVGLRGNIPLGDWAAQFDLYGGGIDYEQEESALSLVAKAQIVTGEAIPFEAEHVIGGHLGIKTPITGLRVGASLYSGLPEKGISPVFDATRRRFVVGGVQAEFLTDRLWLRSEAAWIKDKVPFLSDRERAWYLETGLFVTDRWQLAAGYNRISVDVSNLPFPVPEDITHHDEWSVGVNHWVTPELALKASFHAVSGNLLANLSDPELQQTLLTGRSPALTTRLLQAGVQFSF